MAPRPTRSPRVPLGYRRRQTPTGLPFRPPESVSAAPAVAPAPTLLPLPPAPPRGVPLFLVIYCAVFLLLGLGLVSLPVNVANAATGGSINAAEGFSLPAQMLWLSIAFGLAGGALFVWMLIALVRRGPWAMRRVA